MTEQTFIDAVLAGEADPSEIRDWIGRWHEDEGTSQPLWRFLGFTYFEYFLWVLDPDQLPVILAARTYEE